MSEPRWITMGHESEVCPICKDRAIREGMRASLEFHHAQSRQLMRLAEGKWPDPKLPGLPPETRESPESVRGGLWMENKMKPEELEQIKKRNEERRAHGDCYHNCNEAVADVEALLQEVWRLTAKRFAVFACDHYYPSGGFGDCVSVHRTLEEAESALKTTKNYDDVWIEDLLNLEIPARNF